MEPHEIDQRMMGRALALAQAAAALGEVPVGAVIYRVVQGQVEVVAQAHNRRELDADPTAHAEVLALRAAGRALGTWRMDGCSIAVTLEPCPMCAGALVNSRMQRLVYAAGDPKMGCAGTLYDLCTEARFNHRLTVVPGVLEDQAAAVLREFFRARRGFTKPVKPSADPQR